MKYFLIFFNLIFSLTAFSQVADIKVTVRPICGSENVLVTATLPSRFIEVNWGFSWTLNELQMTHCTNGNCAGTDRNSYSHVWNGHYNYFNLVHFSCLDPLGVLHVSDYIQVILDINNNNAKSICGDYWRPEPPYTGFDDYLTPYKHLQFSNTHISNCSGTPTVIVGENDTTLDQFGLQRAPGRVALNAVNSITFNPGFEARKGSVLLAEARKSCYQKPNVRLASPNDLEVSNYEVEYVKRSNDLEVNNYEEEYVKVFPNPSNGISKISLNKESTVTVYSSTSELFYTKKFLSGISEIDLPEKSGVYFVKIEDGLTTKIERVVVIHP